MSGGGRILRAAVSMRSAKGRHEGHVQETPMIFRRRAAVSALLIGFGACALSVGEDPTSGVTPVSSAHAQLIRNLIARLRGQTLPDGIVKSNGRLEATQVDVSSKYAGRLAEVTVEEGSNVRPGQIIARINSPEYEAQLRAAKADVQKSNDALAAAEAEISARESALEFAKSDFERGQELMKTGFITKQTFEQRKRNFDSAIAAVKSYTSQRDQALSQIANSEAEVDRIESILSDMNLVSPRLGRVQYQLARAGEVVAAGSPVVTILDLTDVYMTIFLPAADAGRLAVGDEARIILDPVPDYVVPATVSFVAADAQFTPKTVETQDERAKLMFRIKLKIDPQVLQQFYTRVKTGVRGLGFVRTNPDAEWPADLEVKLPKPPKGNGPAPSSASGVDQGAPPAAASESGGSDGGAETKTPEAK
jgi:HlyD family secretion protein